jgi:hypothetical protein
MQEDKCAVSNNNHKQHIKKQRLKHISFRI